MDIFTLILNLFNNKVLWLYTVHPFRDIVHGIAGSLACGRIYGQNTGGLRQ